MDINELLCVGRSRKSQSKIENSNRTLRRVGLYTEETTLNSEDWSADRRVILGDREDDNRMSAMYSSGYMTPPKKSILRGKPVSPKYCSPTSSIRSVRFSDKEQEDETVFAKLHLNETTQTDHGNVHKTHHKTKPITCGRSKIDEEFDVLDSQQIRTSTPRYSKAGETPSLEFLTPRKFDDRQTKMLSNSPKASEQKHHKEKLIIDIDITPKSVVKQSPVKDKNDQHKGVKCAKPDGNNIIQNMNLNDSAKPTDKTYIPDGSKITQNMDLHHMNVSSTGTQTMSETSSPRSASPETPCHEHGFPDGSKILRNMELCAPDFRIKMKSESVQTIDTESERLEPEPKSKTVGIQTDDESTCDVLSAPENERCRSLSVQTNLDMSDSSTESLDVAVSRSVAIQTQDQNQAIPDIPDGASITKNMNIHKSPTPKGGKVTRDVKLQHSSLNDSNWNEFVKHLEMFNPSPSSSDSETDDEFPASLKSEPVIVYDSHEHASPVKVGSEPKLCDTRNSSVVQHRESRGAKKLLESGEYTRQQYESVLREEGLLQKMKPSYTQSRSGTVVSKPKHEKSKADSAKTAATHQTMTKKPDDTKYSVATLTPMSYIQASESSRPNSCIQTYVYRDNDTETGNDLPIPTMSSSQRRSSKDSLTFTPIETYSFNPDTLTKTTSNTGVHSLPVKTSPSRDKSPTCDASLGSSFKESVTKNAFIQGVDLGPIPSTRSEASTFGSYCSGKDWDRKSNTTDYVSASHSTSRSLSPKRYMQPTLSSQASGRSYCFSPSRRDNSYSYPLSTSSFTNASSSRLSTGIYQPLQRRPSSSPSSRSRGHPLSSSLREMRNTAVRKSAMSSLLDPKRKSSYDCGSSKYSSSNSPSSSRYKSYEDYDRFTYSGSRSSFAGKPLSSKSYDISESSYRSPSKLTPDDYMNALNDISNARLERSRSRSRSPKCGSVRRSYDDSNTTSSRYSQQQSKSFSDYKEEEMLLDKTEKDEGYVESVTTSRAHTSRKTSAAVNHDLNKEYVENNGSKTERQSRCLYKKPPLPSKSRKSRSRDSSKENGRSARSPSNGKTGSEVNEDRVKPSPVVKEKLLPNKPLRSQTFNNGSSKGDKRCDAREVSREGTITIGSIPSSVMDKACMYLGHETIQKIINDAKL